MAKKVAQIIVEVLEQAGVKRCYGIVGDTLNLIAEHLDKSSIEWVHVRHEEAGAFAAGAEALLTGELTACAGSCGPGSLHFINGLYEANRNRSPMVLIASQITGARPSARLPNWKPPSTSGSPSQAPPCSTFWSIRSNWSGHLLLN